MLDQSFSYENFRILLDVENRKGRYLQDSGFFEGTDYFFESRELTHQIIDINKEIRDEEKKLPASHLRSEDDYKKIRELEDRKEKAKEIREQKLEEILKEVSNNISDKNFTLNIKKGIIKYGSQLYITDNNLENYLVLKQLQRNIFKTFNVKQADRKLIISQIKLLFSDRFPKVVLRTDISSFYESIPHQQLISKIEENSLLSHLSKKIIKSILNQYWKILITDGTKNYDDERVGIPRGIGVSAFLSELYLKDFDSIIKSLPNVVYYSRYVDDIIIVFTPKHRNESLTVDQYRRQTKEIINQFHLSMNNDKTKIYDFRKENSKRKISKKYEITFLGYKFLKYFKKSGKDIIEEPLIVSMSDNKFERFKNKIEFAFESFENDIAKYSGKERQTNKRLIQRIKIITSNFRLYRRKSNVLIGIYFSNEFLTEDLIDLAELDLLLQKEIDRVSTLLSPKTRLALKKQSFVEGFTNKKTLNFNFNKNRKRGVVNIDEILKVWETL